MNPSRWDAEAITSNDREISFYQPGKWLSAESGIIGKMSLFPISKRVFVCFLQESLALHSVFQFSIQQYESHRLFHPYKDGFKQMLDANSGRRCQYYVASEFNRITELEGSL